MVTFQVNAASTTVLKTWFILGESTILKKEWKFLQNIMTQMYYKIKKHNFKF